MQDAMWGGTDAGTRPIKWAIAPFNNEWPGSLVVSQDPVAIDSVGLDACKAAGEPFINSANPTTDPDYVEAPDDYLHEAALIDNPPSGVFYDPDYSGVARSSLGVHEHWNNSTDRQYSRNLSPSGTGIELLWLDVGNPGDANRDNVVNNLDVQAVAAGFGTVRGQPGFNQNTDLNFDGRIDVSDLLQVARNFGNTYP
jgi:hypothetical protein